MESEVRATTPKDINVRSKLTVICVFMSSALKGVNSPRCGLCRLPSSGRLSLTSAVYQLLAEH